MMASRTLQDVVFALHFVGGPMTVLDLASWVEEFNEKGLDVQQHPMLPPTQWAPPGQPQAFIFNMAANQLPRIFLRREDVNEYFVLQNDRVAFAWHRIEPVGEEAAYPGYDELRQRWHTHLERFNRWSARRLGGPRPPRLIELSYQNAFPLDDNEGSRRVPPYFRLTNLGDRTIREFQLAWRELVPDSGGGYVNAAGAIGTVPPARTAFLFNFVGVAPISPQGSSDDAVAVSDRLHTHISDMYAAAIAEEAF